MSKIFFLEFDHKGKNFVDTCKINSKDIYNFQIDHSAEIIKGHLLVPSQGVELMEKRFMEGTPTERRVIAVLASRMLDQIMEKQISGATKVIDLIQQRKESLAAAGKELDQENVNDVMQEFFKSEFDAGGKDEPE